MTDVGQTRLTDFSPRSMGNVDDEHPENDYDGPAFAEVDPSGRYGRFEDILGRGACKIVYKAFDTQEGTEVAWNQVRLADLMCAKDVEKEDRDRMFAEIRVLKALKHKNIMSFYDSWFDPTTLTVNFITELFTSGTLRQYRKRHKRVDFEVLKRWAWQILCGLVYLHGHNPPIIHRDLKCDNIFINGSDGIVKIGDLGLATMLRSRTAPQSVLGTPEFMAPELYEEDYDDRVDVYSFGMALLELATLEYPYAECNNAAQIYRKVSLGVRPVGLQKVTDNQLAEFINTCIAPRNQRPRSRQLLKHPYFDTIRHSLAPSKSELSLAGGASIGGVGVDGALGPIVSGELVGGGAMGVSSAQSINGMGAKPQGPASIASLTSVGGLSRFTSGISPDAVSSPLAAAVGGVDKSDSVSIMSQRSNVSELAAALGAVDMVASQKDSSEGGGIALAYDAGSKVGSRATSRAPSPPASPGSPLLLSSDAGSEGGADAERRGECRCAATNRCFNVIGKYREDTCIFNIRLRIHEPDGSQRTVEFEFDTNTDTVASVASEMVNDLELSPEDVDAVALAMRREISSLSQGMEGQASSSLAKAADLLQHELRENALMVANSVDGPLPWPQSQDGLPRVRTAMLPPPPLPSGVTSLKDLPPGAASILRSAGSASSVHSEASLTSAHSLQSVQSSPAQLIAAASSNVSDMKGAAAAQQQRSVSPPQPSTAPPSASYRLHRTVSREQTDRSFRPVMLPAAHEGGTPVPLDRNPSSGAFSPITSSGILSPDFERRDLDKRSLNKLFENLMEVANERNDNSATPPPVLPGRPPLPSGNVGLGNGQAPPPMGRLPASKSSPPGMWGIAVGGGGGSLQGAAVDCGDLMTSRPISSNGNGPGIALWAEEGAGAINGSGISSSVDASGLIGAKKPSLKDKDALRKQAAESMKAVEMRSLSLFEGNLGGCRSLRGTPMAANKAQVVFAEPIGPAAAAVPVQQLDQEAPAKGRVRASGGGATGHSSDDSA